MESRSVSRCVAIAAHGKRCQQSPFRGSPYCWHHTQSRKIWAPSRPLGGGGGARGVEAPTAVTDADRRLVDRRSGPDRRLGRATDEVAARRLYELLGAERTAELIEFLEAPADGAYLLVRDEGGLLSERSVSERPSRRRS
jgi:hypothetical protein